ncbi:MAG TPA: protein kinase [Bryobacteraceae bacterium]|nr:protein kinase [Bryobacteraceae bacterium]
MKGERLGNYEILDKLGEGGMGEVWRARDQRLNRMVAIKVLPAEVANVPARRARFEQEARALAALNHGNIVGVFDIGEENGRAFLVSELVEGESLRAALERGPLPVRKAIDYGVQIADAMAAAHSVGIVHRDLKPENIMITRTDRVKVLDFGLAKQTMPATDEKTATLGIALSEPGMVMGTAGYMSPEQVRGEAVDHRSDIFSFGSVLYEMVTGKRAFHGPSSVETMHAVLRTEPFEEDPGTASSISPALGGLIRRCLEKRPDQRFQSAADLAFALRAITGTSGSGTQPAVAAAAPPATTRRWLAPTMVAVGSVLLLAAGIFLYGRLFNKRQMPSYERITFRKGYVTGARFTPGGTNIVYAASWEGAPERMYLAVPGNPDARDLGIPDNARLLSVSSKEDLAYLVGPYVKDRLGYENGTLVRTSISGGETRPLLNNVLRADWSPDGTSMAVLRRVNDLYRLEYPIGTVLWDKLTWPLYAIRISPDGKYVAYVVQGQGSSLAMGYVDRSGKRKPFGVVSSQATAEDRALLSWRPDGKEIWYRSLDQDSLGTIYAADLYGKRRVALRLPSRVTFYDIAPDGRLLLSTDSLQVGILGVAPAETTEKDLSCLDASVLRGISEDGSMVLAGVSGRSGSVYTRKTDGSPAVRLGDGFPVALSQDGKWVSGYMTKEGSKRQWFLMPTGAGEERMVDAPGLVAANTVVRAWIDDHRYLVMGGRPNSSWQCFVWDSEANTVKEVCPAGVLASEYPIMLSPDRKKVLAHEPNGLFVYPLDGGAPQEVHGLMMDHDIPIGWRADNRSLYVITHHDTNRFFPLSVLDIASGQKTPWKEIRPSRPVDEVDHLAITPDGRAYAYNFSLLMTDLYVAEGVK